MKDVFFMPKNYKFILDYDLFDDFIVFSKAHRKREDMHALCLAKLKAMVGC